MEYFIIKSLHITFAGIWLANLLTDSVLRGVITNNKQKSGERKFIRLYMTFINLLGIIGSVGILATGIFLVLDSQYGFFDMSANHWLAAKQILMVILLLTIFLFIIPTAKKIKTELGENLESNTVLSENTYLLLQKLYRLSSIVNAIVLINFLFAVTHYLFG